MKYIFLFIFYFIYLFIYLFIYFFIIIFRYAIAYLRTGSYAPASSAIKWLTNANELLKRVVETSLGIAKGLVNVRNVNVFNNGIRVAN